MIGPVGPTGGATPPTPPTPAQQLVAALDQFQALLNELKANPKNAQDPGFQRAMENALTTLHGAEKTYGLPQFQMAPEKSGFWATLTILLSRMKISQTFTT